MPGRGDHLFVGGEELLKFLPADDTFIAVYRGSTIAEARLVTASSDPALVAEVVGRLLSHELAEQVEADPAIAQVAQGRRDALRVIQGELDREGS